MTKISVIIPVYNTASYLKECLDSVLNQSFRDIEVICVNDGSTDASSDILKSYQSKDDRVIVINQDNKGLGAARNIAVSQSKGDYVLFIDSDDFIEEEALMDIYGLAESKSLDLLMFKIINFDSETYETSKAPYFEMNFLKKAVCDEVFDWRRVRNRLFDISVTGPGKLFKRDLIKNIQFPEGLIFEDNVFFIKVMFKAKRVYFYDKWLYYRRVRPDSITNSYFNDFSDCISVYELVEDFLRRSGKYSVFSTQLFNRKCRDIFFRFSTVHDDFKADFFDKIKQNFQNHQKHLQSEGILDKCYRRSSVIFESALTSQTYREFELSVNLFDLEKSHDKLKLDYDIATRRYKNKVNKLTEERDEYLDEIEELKNSTSWRITSIFRDIGNSFKK